MDESITNGMKITLNPSKSTESINSNNQLTYTKILNLTKSYVEKGRQLSTLFLKLPNKSQYPDYYHVIHTPIAFENIEAKISKKLYKSPSEFEEDFQLMIQNAKTYNRKNSTVYNDAQTLKQVFDGNFEREFRGIKDATVSRDSTPVIKINLANTTLSNNAPAENNSVTKIKINLSNSASSENLAINNVFMEEYNKVIKKVSNLKDRDGRLVCELFLELPDKFEYPDYYVEIKKPIALETIKENINTAKYLTRQDFENDFQLMCQNAMQYNAEGSDVYNDAQTLKSYFLSLMGKENEDDLSPISLEDVTYLDAIEYKNQVYKIGDYVYTENPDAGDKPTVVQITDLWKQNKKPEQTVHKATQKFMENEVLKTNHYANYRMHEVKGRCYVLFYKDYIRGKPKGYEFKDVYVCESRYNEQAKSSTKIKSWPSCLPEKLKNSNVELDLDLYPQPYIPNKVNSIYYDESLHQTQQSLSRKRKLSEIDIVSNSSPAIPRSNSKGPPESIKQLSKSLKMETPLNVNKVQHVTPLNSTANSANSKNMLHSPAFSSSSLQPSKVLNPVPSETFKTTMQTPVGSNLNKSTPISSASLSMPQAVAPNPLLSAQLQPNTSSYLFQEMLPEKTVSLFDKTDDGQMKWFTAPPVNVEQKKPLLNSMKYLLNDEKKIDKKKNELSAKKNIKNASKQESDVIMSDYSAHKQPEKFHDIFNGVEKFSNSNISENTEGNLSRNSVERNWAPVTDVLNGNLCNLYNF
ncbi:hypothetical protein HK099_000555 [Clydaea vesicula]|uniref:Uncharacterized protein n=1 Tax=Clydaea vesicula TaxID=447962 RepID=A0AAD5Y003_9FUNG|nr:hypothetical protein HK099_000555 [Clydaea vesicula]